MSVTDSVVVNEINAYINGNYSPLVSLDTKMDVVKSVDSKTINFYLKTSDGTIESKQGYLIEVYESGSDGSLNKLLSENVVDPVSNNKISEGFTQYFYLAVDD